VGRRDLVRLAIIGILLLVTANVVLGWAETYIPTGLAALFIAVTPLWFLILERMSHSTDRLSRRGLAGIALGVLGVAILIWPDLSGHANFGAGQLFGSVLVLLSSISWACGSILTKRWHMTVDPYTASGWQMLFAGLINGTLALAIGDPAPRHLGRQLALGHRLPDLCRIARRLHRLRLAAQERPHRQGGHLRLRQPHHGALIGCTLHGEKMDGYMVAGSVVVIFSVVLVTGAKVRHLAVEEEALESGAGRAQRRLASRVATTQAAPQL
jgi:drug/metabolite transporter (DMT)-like permease